MNLSKTLPPPQEAFLPNDIITVLSNIISTHIKDSKHTYQLQKRSQASSKDPQKRPKVHGKKNKTKDMLSSSDDDDDDVDSKTNTSKKNEPLPPLSYFCISYSQLMDVFQQYTGHGWTGYHLEIYGTMKSFLLKHSQQFLVHVSSDRVGLVSEHQHPESFLQPQYDAQGKRLMKSDDDYLFDNDMYRITSPHLYTQLTPTIPLQTTVAQLSTHELQFHQYIAYKHGNSDQLLHSSAGQNLNSINHILDNIESSHPHISTINRTATSMRPQFQLNKAQSTPSPANSTKKNSQSSSSPTQRSEFDHYDMEEKLKNRGCAPQAQSGLKMPLYLIFFTLFLIILFGALLHFNTIQALHFGDNQSFLYKMVHNYQQFVQKFVRDFTQS